MEKYDVIVIGAGPAGSTAAKAAAVEGMKTIMFEEHPQIGIPEHCMGLIASPKGTPLAKVIESTGERVIYRRLKARRIFSPSGKTRDMDFGGAEVLVIERQLFDIELANQASDAGVKIAVNAGVTGIIEEGGVVVGVKTNSPSMPEVYGNIVIAADGLRGLLKGVATWTKLNRPVQKVNSGMRWYFSRVDVEEDLLGIYLGDFSERGFISVAPIGNKCCLTDMLSLKELEIIRSGDWPCSKIFRNANVMRMTGFAHPIPMGVILPQRVKDGLLLAGDACGLLGIDAAVSTGMAAGAVAAAAVKKGDVTEAGLSEYTRISDEIGRYEYGYSADFNRLDVFFGKKDAEIEELYETTRL